METRVGLSRPSVARFVGEAALMVIVVVLALEVRSLRPQARELQVRRAHPHLGQWVPVARAGTLSGDSVTIGETVGGRRQLLFVFTAECQHCRDALASWRRLAKLVSADSSLDADVIWLSLSSPDATREYAARYLIEQPVLRFPTDRIPMMYGIRAVPLTLALDDSGRVVFSRGGALDSPAISDSVVAALRHASAAGRSPPAQADNTGPVTAAR